MITNILLFIVSLALGWTLGKLLRPRRDGFLVIDSTNPDKDVYTLEIHTPFEEIAKKKSISLKIQHFTGPSQD